MLKTSPPTYQTIKAELKKGSISPTYLFMGEENYLKEEIVLTIKRLIFKDVVDESDFNLDILYGDEVDAVKIVDLAKSYSFFTSKRLIVVKRLEKLSSQDKAILAAYIEQPSSDTCLILIANKIDKDSLLYQAVSKKGQIVMFYPLFDNEVKIWIAAKCQAAKKRILPEAIELLLQRIGNSLQELDMEINKFITFIGERDVVTEEDIIQTSGEFYQNTVFDLGIAIGQANQEKATQIFRNLFLQGEAPVKVLFMITRHLRLLWQVKLLQEERIPESKIVISLKIWSKKEQAVLLKQAASFSHNQLTQAFELLLASDLELKSRDSKTYSIIIESLIHQLCHL